jgi:hypothetical protein
MSYYHFECSVQIVRHNSFTVLFLPDAIARQLPFDRHPRLRVEGEIAEVPFEGAWQPASDSAHYLMVPKRVMAEAGVGPGSQVEMRFRIGDQDAVNIPDALQAALENDAVASLEWDKLTAGRKRSFSYRVSSAKTYTTIAKRLDEVIGMIVRGEFYAKGGKDSGAAKTGG